MRTVIVNSSTDPAGVNIHDRLVEDFNFKETGEKYDGFPIYSLEDSLLVTSKEQIVFIEDLGIHFPKDSQCIFISRHQAKSGVPSLTCHFTGNFGKNEFGGNPCEIARFSPSLLKQYFVSLCSLREEIHEKYKLTLEATHHGPTSLHNTVLFVELGSGPEQWKDREGAHYVAKALASTMKKPNQPTFSKCALAFGGTHYPEKANKFLLEEREFALGPIVPKYSLGLLNENIMQQLVQKGDQKVTHAAIDMKGLSVHKDKVVKLVSDFGLEIVRL